MSLVKLTTGERKALAHTAQHSTDARETRRALALLDLADGQKSVHVAVRYQVSRSTVYEWVARWNDEDTPQERRLRDAHRPGRPAEQRNAVAEMLAELMMSAPPTHPSHPWYRCRRWTVGLLVFHLDIRFQLDVSEHTVRRAMHCLGYRWERNQFVKSQSEPK
jgi:transposase